MPKFKTDDYDVDWDALEEAEYDDTPSQARYDGEDPPVDTILSGYVKSMWMTETKNEDPMIKALFIASANEGEEEKFNGWPGWENAALIPGAKFRWAPMFNVLGFTLKDVRGKLYVGDDDNVGIPIEKIGPFKPGEENDTAWCRVLIGREKYNGEWQTRIGQWLPWDETEEEAETAMTDAGAEAEEAIEDEEEEAEEQATTPARGRPAARTASKPAATPARSSSPGPARNTRTTAGRAATPAKAAPARARGRAAAAADAEPPF